MKKGILILIAIVAFLIIGIYLINYNSLQSKMNDILMADSRNHGIDVTVHYENYVLPSVLIYDLKTVGSDNSRADVFRVLLQFAEKIKSSDFKTVKLLFKRREKFLIDGDYFHQLGEEYQVQNPIYTMRTFSENLRTPEGAVAYPGWTGGLLGVLAKQMDDFNDFHEQWYGAELSF